MTTPNLQTLCDCLGRIAPLHLAETWDNVGLLIRPTRPRAIGRLMLTIDLTPEVLLEAIDAGAAMVIAYHPPIFHPLTRLSGGSAAQWVVQRAMEAGLAVYSPHTALDAAPGGMTDWLAGCAARDEADVAEIRALRPHVEAEAKFKVVVFTPLEHVDAMRLALSQTGAGGIGLYRECSFNLEGVGTFRGMAGSNPAIGKPGRLERVAEIRLEMICGQEHLPGIRQAIQRTHPYEEPAWELHRMEPARIAEAGAGRLVTLARPAKLAEVVKRIARRLGLRAVRAAKAARHSGKRGAMGGAGGWINGAGGKAAGDGLIRRVAVCPGAGGSLFAQMERDDAADLYLTGEMRHHEILGKLSEGASVMLTDHTNTERPYLKALAARLRKELPGLKVLLSRKDREPLDVTIIR